MMSRWRPPISTVAYRHSSVRADQVVVSADARVGGSIAGDSRGALSEIVRGGARTSPAGATPVGVHQPARRLGRSADRRRRVQGMRVGTAEVSTKHANFIQADPGGHAADVVALMAEVRRRVRDSSGVDLRAETRLVGFDTETVRRRGRSACRTITGRIGVSTTMIPPVLDAPEPDASAGRRHDSGSVVWRSVALLAVVAVGSGGRSSRSWRCWRSP